jgi:hypothetical protein
MIGIGDQRVRQIKFADKFLVRFFAVPGNSENNDVFFCEGVVCITKRTCFLGSARRVVFGVKPYNHALALKILEADRVSVLVSGCKYRRFIAFF